MNLLKKTLALGALALATAQMSYAVPAYPKPFKVKQADGSYVTIQLRGDEYSHLAFSQDGYPLVFNDATGNFEYAKLSNSLLLPSGITAREAGMRSVADKAYLQTIDNNSVTQLLLAKAVENRAAMAAAPSKQTTANGPRKIAKENIFNCKISDYPTMGKVKALVILVDFNDKKFTDGDAAAWSLWNKKLNGRNYTENGATGSVWDYYHQGSAGQYDPDFRVVGPVKVSKGYSYYGNNSYNGDDYGKVGELVQEACKLAADSINYADFDTDNDGKVDNVYFIYAGYGEADSHFTNAIWPHSYYYSYLTEQYPSKLKELEFDGKTVDRYTMSQEINGQTNRVVGIGTFTHEFGHVLGFADHYHTTNPYASGQVAEWDLMASGSYNNDQNTPPTLSAFERAQLGWLEPTQLSASTDSLISLPCLLDSNFAYAVSIPGNDNEGFLIENRQQKGWDKYLPGHGMLVWHIDLDKSAWQTNSVNNNPSHMRVDVVEADKTANADSGDPFPGTSNVTQFTFKSWTGQEVFTFADVQEPTIGGEINFLLKTDNFAVKAPTAIWAENILGKSMEAVWNKSSMAKNYTLVVSSANGEQTYENLTDTTLSLTNLTPETAYTLKVVSNMGIYSSDTVEKVVNTLPLQFQERTAVALPATAVDTTSFIAHWEEVPGTAHYYLNVFERSLDKTIDVSYGFDSKADGLPAGWTTNSTVYSSSLYGESSPSLRFRYTADSLLITSMGDSLIQAVRFLYNGTVADNAFIVKYLNQNDEWTVADSAFIEKARQEATVSLNLDNAKAVSISFLKKSSTGYGIIDDVSVTQIAPVDVPIDWLTGIDAGTALSYEVKGLLPAHRYSYNVYAVNAEQHSGTSALVVLQTLGDTATGIKAIDNEFGAEAAYFDLNGRRIDINAAPTGVYIVRKAGKTYKVLKR